MGQVLPVTTNVPDCETAEAMARHAVQRQLAACVNGFPGVKSIYRWHGVVKQAEEIGLAMKTKASRHAELAQAIESLHPYEVPEIVVVPVTQGLSIYLEWIRAVALEKPKE